MDELLVTIPHKNSFITFEKKIKEAKAFDLHNLKDVKEKFVSSYASDKFERFKPKYTRNEKIQEHLGAFLDASLRLPSKVRELKNAKYGYRFPANDRTKSYLGEAKMPMPPDGFINQDPESYKLWHNGLKRQIKATDKKGDYYVELLTGKVGSGKSSFIKYFAITSESEFKRNKIITAVIEYRKELFSKAENLCDTFWEEYFINEALKLLVAKCLREPDLLDDQLNAAIKRWCDNTQEINELRKLIDLYTSGEDLSAESRRVAGNLSTKTKRYILNELKKIRSLKYLVIFDGFDNFSLEAITKGNQEHAFCALRSVVLGSNIISGDEEFPVHFLVALRNCTYVNFIKLHNEREVRDSIADITNRHILPVGVDQVVDRIAEEICHRFRKNKSFRENRIALKAFMQNLLEKIRIAFDLHDDEQIVYLFNHNYRRLTGYLGTVYNYYIDHLARSEFPPTHHSTILKEVLSEENIDKYIKSHELVEIFFLSNQSGFENYYQFDNNSHTQESELFDAGTCFNGNCGFVDNIFNYHIKRKATENTQLPRTLVKLRILQIIMLDNRGVSVPMRQTVNHKSLNDIQDVLVELGYHLDEQEISITLQMMVGAGFLRVRWGGELLYNVTRLGEWVANKLVVEVRYIEKAVQRMLVPSTLQPFFWSGSKYTYDSLGPAYFIFNSFINYYLWVRLVRGIEVNEKNENNAFDKGWALGAEHEVRAQLKVLKNMALSTVYADRYINMDKVVNQIEEFDKQISAMAL